MDTHKPGLRRGQKRCWILHLATRRIPGPKVKNMPCSVVKFSPGIKQVFSPEFSIF